MKKDPPEIPPESNDPSVTRLPAPTPTPVDVTHLEVPPRKPRRPVIHPRRTLRRVPEGKERAFHSLTDRVMFHALRSPAAAILAATDELTLVTNTALTKPGQQQTASNVGEPSVSINGKVVMYTGNWYAARSADGGRTFQFIDPSTSFPAPPNLVFCCDQVVNYISAIDTFVWLLQYGTTKKPEIDNIQRLAFAKTADVAAGKWRLLDITTKSLGVAGEFMDFPDLAVGANTLYVTTNLFNSAGRSTGAAVVRIPFSSIAGGPASAQHFVSRTLDSFRVAQNCGKTAFFAAHQDTSTLAVLSWDEGKTAPVSTDVGVARWIGLQGYQSRTPDGKRWLDRLDPRITGAALAGDELWFAWSVDKGSNRRPQPFVQIARIDAANLTLLDNINIFDPDSAIAYGGLSSNTNKEIGISYMIGGGSRFPSHMVGILTGARKDALVHEGARSPSDGEWGDYLTVRPVFSGPPDNKQTNLFAATGYTMDGPGDGSDSDATPRFVVFGRAGDTGGIAVVPPPPVGPTPPGPTPSGPVTPVPTPPEKPAPLPPTPPTDGGPITDVNTLPVVSATVAAKIKTAAGLGPGLHAAPMPLGAAALPPPVELDKPGQERWPVKTGQDKDRAKVGKNVVKGENLGAGIVEATLEELVALPRPTGLEDPSKDPPKFRDIRDGVAEVTIWRIEARIIGLKHESDGDYHLVLQGATPATMVAEIPTATTTFIGDSPWLANIRDARREIDDKLIKHLSPANFALVDDHFVPQAALTFQPRLEANPHMSFVTPPEGSPATQPLFAVSITPKQARITGVGFFDRAHGADGAAKNVIEIHPVLKVEWV